MLRVQPPRPLPAPVQRPPHDATTTAPVAARTPAPIEDPAPTEPAARRTPDALDAVLRRSVAERTTGPVVARAKHNRSVTIRGERFTHASRKRHVLFAQVVVPFLEAEGYKSRGVPARLQKFIREQGGDYKSNKAFKRDFRRWLRKEKRKVRGGKMVPVVRRFDARRMARPSWPKTIREEKGATPGDHIRHVVRNATLKNALTTEYDNLKGDTAAAAKRFAEIATTIELDTSPFLTTPDLVAGIYKAVYLNTANLFAGQGPFNSVIGFSADSVSDYGEQLSKLGGQRVDRTAVHAKVIGDVRSAAASVRGSKVAIAKVVGEIDEVVKAAIATLAADDNGKVDAVEAGGLVADIGLGLGFDLLDGRIDDDRDDIALRQRRLLWSEVALGRFTRSGGQTGDLRQILGVFMGKVGVPGA